MHEIVHQNRAIGELGLANYIHGAWIIEEKIMHETGPPRTNTVRTTIPHVADETVPAAVEVAGGVIPA